MIEKRRRKGIHLSWPFDVVVNTQSHLHHNYHHHHHFSSLHLSLWLEHDGVEVAHFGLVLLRQRLALLVLEAVLEGVRHCVALVVVVESYSHREGIDHFIGAVLRTDHLWAVAALIVKCKSKTVSSENYLFDILLDTLRLAEKK